MDEYESKFDKKIWKVGGSVVITIPADTMEKLGLHEGEILEVAIKRAKK
jgi:antitoxin component of MazEF toxin-antitoxin module